MGTTMATKSITDRSSRLEAGMVIIFYLLTFLTGGFLLFVGERLGFIGDLAAVMFYIAVTVVFYAQSKRAQAPTVN